MKLINKIKNNILGFIIGGIVFSGIGVTIASQILAIQVSYSYENSPSNVTNVDGALTELYKLAEECQNASSSGSSVTYYGKDAVAVYLDPTNLNTPCSSATSSDTGTKSGCMRFYVYAEDGEYKYAILDHNTTTTVNSFYVAQSQVKQDTASWDPNLQARNIRADEVYKITESTNNIPFWQVKQGNQFYFNATNSSGTEGNGQGYGWLFDKTYNCTNQGCTIGDSSTYGYWTSDARDSSSAWLVDCVGSLSKYNFNLSGDGVRPVIQIAK